MYQGRGGLVNKKLLWDALKIIVFISLANLPFITIAHQVGLDIFLDSFDNPDYYNILEDISLSDDSYVKNGESIIIQRSSHPEFTANKGDIILHYKIEKGYCCNKIYEIETSSPVKQYYTVGCSYSESEPVHEYCVIGKVVGVVDKNIWNSLAITFWEASINNLNIKSIVTNE
jgi:hypothetical protein